MQTIKKDRIIEMLQQNRAVYVRLLSGVHSSISGTPICRLHHVAGGSAWVTNPATSYVCRIPEGAIEHAFVADKESVEASAQKFILWCPTSNLPPRVVHDSREKAESVAREMATKHPGQEFIVCALVAKAHTPKPEVTLINL